MVAHGLLRTEPFARPSPLLRSPNRPHVHDDDVAPFFADLFALLLRAESRRDYESPQLTDAAARGAVAARAAGVPPERVLAYLHTRARAAPLCEIGDWYRGVLVDRLVARAIEAYFGVRGDG